MIGRDPLPAVRDQKRPGGAYERQRSWSAGEAPCLLMSDRSSLDMALGQDDPWVLSRTSQRKERSCPST